MWKHLYKEGDAFSERCTMRDPLHIIAQVMWKHLYKEGDAFSERCTMPQLQSLINRSNLPINPKNAAEDFVEVSSCTVKALT